MPEFGGKPLREAILYKGLEEGKVKCLLCRRGCLIPEKGRGQCGVRKNIGGRLYSLVFGRTITMEIDPIEKKPLYHFRPGSQCLGISTYGCNFFCLHCQNYSISQQRQEDAIASVPFIPPEEIVKQALDAGIEGIAYTYTEPTIFAEYALETMRIARRKGLYNVWVSNGYMTRQCIDEIAPFLDAANIDLKGDARFYREVCGKADLDGVKDSISYMHGKGLHLEITNLIVPGYNDRGKDFEEVSSFVKSLNPLMPLHFTRFWPQYKMQHLPPTDVGKLRRAKEVAEKAGLKHVYVGNVYEDENTNCPECGAVLIRRSGFASKAVGLGSRGECSKCGAKTGIVP